MEKILDMVNPWLEMIGPATPYIMALVLLILGRIVVGLIAGRIGKATTKSLSKGSTRDSAEGIGKSVKSLLLLIGILFVGVVALDVAGLEQALEPLKQTFGEFAAYAPKLIGAGILLYIVWTVTNLVGPLVGGFANQAVAKMPMKMDVDAGGIASNLVKGGILLLMLPAVLGTAQIPGITEPLSNMVQQCTDYAPTLFTALVLIGLGGGIAYVISQILGSVLAATPLDSMTAQFMAPDASMASEATAEGFEMDSFADELENAEAAQTACEKDCSDFCPEQACSDMKMSGIIAAVVGVSIFVPILAQGLNLLQLEFLSSIATGILGFYAKALGAVALVGIAYFAMNWLSPMLKPMMGGNEKIVRFVVLGYVALIAVSNLGVSGAMIDYPFQAFVTAAAVALGLGGAIAVGMGGSDFVKSAVSDFNKQA